MPLNKLRRSFEERRLSLVEKLQKSKEELDLSQQHQIYGAIKEIENFLKSIDYYRTLEAEQAFEFDLSKEREWPIVKRTGRAIKSVGKGLWSVVTWTFVRMPAATFHGIRGSMEEYRERREFYRKAKEQYDMQKQQREDKF